MIRKKSQGLRVPLQPAGAFSSSDQDQVAEKVSLCQVLDSAVQFNG